MGDTGFLGCLHVLLNSSQRYHRYALREEVRQNKSNVGNFLSCPRERLPGGLRSYPHFDQEKWKTLTCPQARAHSQTREWQMVGVCCRHREH